MTVSAEEPIIRYEIDIVEPNAERAEAIEVRSRPVVAAGTDVVDKGPVPVARSGQEDCAIGFELVRPIASRDAVAAETRIGFVGVEIGRAHV